MESTLSIVNSFNFIIENIESDVADSIMHKIINHKSVANVVSEWTGFSTFWEKKCLTGTVYLKDKVPIDSFINREMKRNGFRWGYNKKVYSSAVKLEKYFRHDNDDYMKLYEITDNVRVINWGNHIDKRRICRSYLY